MFTLLKGTPLHQAEETRLWSEYRRHEYLGTVGWSVTSQSEAECEHRSRLAMSILQLPEPITKRVRILQEVVSVWNDFDKFVFAGCRVTSDSQASMPDKTDGSNVEAAPSSSGLKLQYLASCFSCVCI